MDIDYLHAYSLLLEGFGGAHGALYHNSGCKDGYIFTVVDFVGFEKVEFIVLVLKNIRSFLAEHTDINGSVMLDNLRQRLL